MLLSLVQAAKRAMSWIWNRMTHSYYYILGKLRKTTSSIERSLKVAMQNRQRKSLLRKLRKDSNGD